MYTVMVAEDQEEMRELLRDALLLEGNWNVAAMPSGFALLHTAASLIPDVVLLDIAMPGIDGLDTYRALREREEMRDVPVLFVTANPQRLAGVALRGPYDLLVKPFTLDELVARVTALASRTPRPTQAGSAE